MSAYKISCFLSCPSLNAPLCMQAVWHTSADNNEKPSTGFVELKNSDKF